MLGTHWNAEVRWIVDISFSYQINSYHSFIFTIITTDLFNWHLQFLHFRCISTLITIKPQVSILIIASVSIIHLQWIIRNVLLLISISVHLQLSISSLNLNRIILLHYNIAIIEDVAISKGSCIAIYILNQLVIDHMIILMTTLLTDFEHSLFIIVCFVTLLLTLRLLSHYIFPRLLYSYLILWILLLLH